MAAPAKLDSKPDKPNTQVLEQDVPSEPEPEWGSDVEASNPKGGRKPAGDLQNYQEDAPGPKKKGGSRRIVPVHQSRIKDRPIKEDQKDSSLKIKIELDLEVEVEIYARVKGDVTIGLM
ncbi:hypothetical protein GX50_07465 [[Emmonsia] crescens]|uniref:Uncharacterized protein n=1 Tax=[Emmonsia] crescens TaxID=73230 RepID=A0A2B7Z0A9_9EURO|nr:hypothetical protein GX50_07465 [Emmonsia crescens]